MKTKRHHHKSFSIIATATFAAFAVLFSGCNSKVMKGSPSGTIGVSKPGATISFADVHDRVLGPVCQHCHDEFATYAGVLTPDHVVPGNPSASGIFFRLKNNPGGDMPNKAPMIPDADAALIRDWIAQGAPEFIAGSAKPAPAPQPKPQPSPPVNPGPAPKPQPSPPQAPVSFADVKTAILDGKCLRCHGAGSTRGDLSTYAGTMKYVIANNFAGSDLIKNLQNFGGEMPKKSGPLTNGEVALLKNWIDSGAPEITPTKDPAVVAPALVSFSDVQTKVFAAKCVMCHSDSKLTAGFSLENYDSIVVNKRLVDAAKPDESGLYQSVIDDFMPPKKMVAAGEVQALTPDEKTLLKSWLEAGAPR